MGKDNKLRLAGALGGLVNGVFGGGGGMVLLPLLGRWGDLRPKAVFANCVAVILPVSPRQILCRTTMRGRGWTARYHCHQWKT